MSTCEECGRELGVLEGYQHPILGHEVFLCSGCFDDIFESVSKWLEFTEPYEHYFEKNHYIKNNIKKNR